MEYAQGEVWWGPAPQKSDAAYRPWLIISNSSHPFSDVECIGAGMTTQRHPDAIPIPDDAWVSGGSRKEAYVSPWYVTTIKRRDLDNPQGTLAESIVADTLDVLQQCTAMTDV